MTKAFVDTDVIIRLVTGDDLVKQQSAVRLFQAVEEGRLQLQAPDTVIADAVYVLSSPRLYATSRTDVRDLLATLLRLQGFVLVSKLALLRALDIFADSAIDFGDCLIIASMEATGTSELYSFDRDFDKFQSIQRLEPVA